MSSKRVCQNCGGDIPQERQSGAKYCTDSCKARYHEKKLMKELFSGEIQKTSPSLQIKKDVVKPAQNLLSGLEGVAERKVQTELAPVQTEVKNNTENGVQYVQYGTSEQKSKPADPPQLTPVTIKVETPKYLSLKRNLDIIQKEYDRVKGMIHTCDTQIEEIKRRSGFSLLPATTTATGGILAYNKMDQHIGGTLGGMVVGYGAGKLIDSIFFEEDRKKEAEQSITKIEEEKKKWQKSLAEVTDIKQKGETLLASIPRYETKTVMRPSLVKLLKSWDDIKSDHEASARFEGTQPKSENTEIPENNTLVCSPDRTTNEEKFPAIETNDKIMSSRALKEMTYPALVFKNRWNDFLGEPSTTFHLVVHGKPGEGKSTFCIQFADYLARHHGNTVYISGEEGFSKTLQQKIIMTKADSPRLFFADLRSFDEIKDRIEDKFHFIFIDSLDTLRIDSQKLKELKALHPSSAIITISQSTKDGKMRGSQEIIHDADIAVCVYNGIAVTTKNRFKEKEMKFSVFPKAKTRDNKIPSNPHSIVI
jgi:hypothetical protein